MSILKVIITASEIENKSLMLSSILFNINAPSPTCFWGPLQLLISSSMTSKTLKLDRKWLSLTFEVCDCLAYSVISDTFPSLLLSSIIYYNLKVRIQKVTYISVARSNAEISIISSESCKYIMHIIFFWKIHPRDLNSVSIPSSGYTTIEFIKREIK